MQSSFTHSNFSGVVSLNDQKNIFFKIVDTITFLSYEATVDVKELRVPYDIASSYKIIVNSFNKANENYCVTLQVTSGFLKCTFRALFEGFLETGFEIILKEKLIAADGQLTINLNRVEQQHASQIKTLAEQIAKLVDENKAIRTVLEIMQSRMNGCQVAYSKGSMVSAEEVTVQFESIEFVGNFYKLKKLIIRASNRIDANLSALVKCMFVKEIDVQLDASHGLNQNFKSIEGLQNLPELEKVSIEYATHLSDLLDVLSSYPHKIKTILLKNCSFIQQNPHTLTEYCHRNNIMLSIS